MLHTMERPLTFDQVKGQEEVVKNLRNQSIRGLFSPFYIFEGNKGSGKTTMARIIARAVNCLDKDENGNPCCECENCKAILADASMDYIEIDGASNNGVEQARRVIEDTNYMPAQLNKKIVVIDEAHMLSNGAFNAFLKTLEEPPEYCMFIMATTDVQKIPATVRSRAMLYTFNRIPSAVIAEHLVDVAKKHDVTLEPAAAALIAKKSNGAMRDALSELEKCIMQQENGIIKEEDVSHVCGMEDSAVLLNLLKMILQGNLAKSFEMVDVMYAKGRDMVYVISQLLEIIADTIRLKHCGNNSGIIANTKEYLEEVMQIASASSDTQLAFLANSMMQLKQDLRRDNDKNIVLMSISLLSNSNVMEERLSALEKRLQALENGQPATPTVAVEKEVVEKITAEKEQHTQTTTEQTVTVAEKEKENTIEPPEQLSGSMFDALFHESRDIENIDCMVDTDVNYPSEEIPLSAIEVLAADTICATALQCCSINNTDTSTNIETHFAPIAKLLSFYIEVNKLQNVQVLCEVK